MECVVFIPYILVVFSALLADSFPQIQEDCTQAASQGADLTNVQKLPQNNANENYQPHNLEQGFQDISFEPWTTTARLSQYPLHSNLAVVNNGPNDYHELQSQEPYNQRLSQQGNKWSQNIYKSPEIFKPVGSEVRPNDVNDIARSNVLNGPQNYGVLKPELQPSDIDRSALPQNMNYLPSLTSERHQQIPGFRLVNKVPSEELWNSQILPNQQAKHIFEKPHAVDPFVNRYLYPVDQNGQKYGNYDQRYSQYPTTVAMITNPVDEINNYGQGWLPKSLHEPMSIPSLVEYLPWPVQGYQNMPLDELLQIDHMNNEYNRPELPFYSPSNENNFISYVGSTTVDAKPVHQNGDKQIVPSQQSLKEQNAAYRKHYVIVHVNGTYEHVNDLDDIVVDEFNVAHIKSKDVPNQHVLAVIEVEDKAIDKESQKSLEISNDTGRSKNPQEMDWDSNNAEQPGNCVTDEETASPAEKNNNLEISTSTDTSIPSTREHEKLREDLQIDPGSLKTVLDKPVVWFRPDEKFWDKVTKGDQAYDVLSLYNVKCQPKLIERFTTVNHYANGTEIMDYVETIWNSPSDLNPKEVKTNRVVINPQH